MNLKAYLPSRQKTIDRALNRYLPKENVRPATIHKAMRYSLFAGGERLRPILCLAAAGACGGKAANLAAEVKNARLPDLRYIHQNKTAAILTASVCLGAMSANATAKELAAMTKFGRALGLAFQVIDDILDVTQTSEKLGKSAGKDIAAQKATYPAIIGLDKSRAEAKQLTKQAHAALAIFGAKGDALHTLANYLLEREY